MRSPGEERTRGVEVRTRQQQRRSCGLRQRDIGGGRSQRCCVTTEQTMAREGLAGLLAVGRAIVYRGVYPDIAAAIHRTELRPVPLARVPIGEGERQGRGKAGEPQGDQSDPGACLAAAYSGSHAAKSTRCGKVCAAYIRLSLRTLREDVQFWEGHITPEHANQFSGRADMHFANNIGAVDVHGFRADAQHFT